MHSELLELRPLFLIRLLGSRMVLDPVREPLSLAYVAYRR